ncbi:DedA family protein [Plesiomonas sp.]|uniref:DedA family protein n=1 Tax=Plesiomonas sp. TaxID=2486279 RepID=UPI003F36C4FA
MSSLFELFSALLHLDVPVLSNPSISLLVCVILVSFIILENGFIPTAFLPGDSLLFLTGTLIQLDVLPPSFTIVLVIAACLGSWFSYLQGRLFGHTKLFNRLIHSIDEKYRQRTFSLIEKHGALTLLVARYIAFVRTIYPSMIGVTGYSQFRFFLINVVSSILWVVPIVTLGYFVSNTHWATEYEALFFKIVITVPAVLLVSGLGLVIYKKVKPRR